jgi:glutamine synthetase
MFRENGQPDDDNPRRALAAVVARYKARGLTPVCAMELEFFLIDDSGKTMQVPASPRSGKRREAAETLSIRALDAFDTVFTDLYDAREAMDSPAVTSTSEAGPGQFEGNLMHSDDAFRRCLARRR